MAVEAESPAACCVAPHVRCLRLCGYLRVPPAARHHRAHEVYRAFALLATTLYLLQECVYAYQERADMDRLARVMFLLLCHLTSLTKQLVFHSDATRIDALRDLLHDPAFNPGDAPARALLASTARAARRVHRAYSGCAVLTCLLWVVFPVLRRARGLRVHFPLWLPVDYQRPPQFALTLLYSFYGTALVGVANTTMDAFMATLLQQCTAQLTLLRRNFERLSERAEKEARRCGERYETAAMRLFVEGLVHYEKISEMAALLQDIFGSAILVQFGIGGWILCMAAYKLVSLSVLSIEFASMCLFMVCIFTELFLYCYYGNALTVQSSLLLDALYCSGWERAGARGGGTGAARGSRRALLLCMERARRPLRAAAARVVPLSLDTFVKIMKSSYTFYAVLRQTK